MAGASEKRIRLWGPDEAPAFLHRARERLPRRACVPTMAAAAGWSPFAWALSSFQACVFGAPRTLTADYSQWESWDAARISREVAELDKRWQEEWARVHIVSLPPDPTVAPTVRVDEGFDAWRLMLALSDAARLRDWNAER